MICWVKVGNIFFIKKTTLKHLDLSVLQLDVSTAFFTLKKYAELLISKID